MPINDNDRKLAELINEEWAWVVPPNSWGGYHTPSENGVPLPFSTDPAAAWQLQEKMLIKYQVVVFKSTIQQKIVDFYDNIDGEWCAHGIGETYMIALVKAAINSLEEK